MEGALATATYLDVIRTETDRFAAAVERGLQPPVPSCPGWTVADIAQHLAFVQRWVARIVEHNSQERPTAAPDVPVPTDARDYATYLREGSAVLADLLAAPDEPEPVWGWGGTGHRWWARRQAHEAALHRWDCEGAHGEPSPIDPPLAADGIDEVLANFPKSRGARSLPGQGETLHLHCTDTDGEWLVTFGAGTLELERAHAKGDAALRGPAFALLCFLWGRDIPGVETLGDAAVPALWRDNVRF